VDGVPGAFPNPAYGQLQGLGIALFVLIVILCLIRWGAGFIANVAVLLGIVAGAAVASVVGFMHFDKVASAPWFDIVIPFRFGIPEFHLVPIVTMCIVMIVVMIESVGMFLALSELTNREIDQVALTRGLRADGVGTILGGIFNTIYVLLPERQAGWRYRCEVALGHGHWRMYHAWPGFTPQNVSTGRGCAPSRTWRSRIGDVRHGSRNRRSHLDER
jgi:Permease family